MEEKKQKKIKASGTPAKLAGYLSNLAAYLSHWVGGSDAFFTEEFVEIGDGLL